MNQANYAISLSSIPPSCKIILTMEERIIAVHQYKIKLCHKNHLDTYSHQQHIYQEASFELGY